MSNTVMFSNSSLLYMYFSALGERNSIVREMRVSRMKIDTIFQVITDELPDLIDDPEIVERKDKLLDKLSGGIDTIPMFAAMNESIDALKPFVDSFKEYDPEGYKQILKDLRIDDEHIIAMAESEIKYKIISGRETNSKLKDKPMSDNEKLSARQSISRTFDEIERNIPGFNEGEGGADGKEG